MVDPLFQTLSIHGWHEVVPERGGVRRQFECHGSPTVKLLLEERIDSFWLWIDDDTHGRAVLSLDPGSSPVAVAQVIVRHQAELSAAAYLKACRDFGRICPTAIVAWEQFERPYVNYLPPHGDAICKFFQDVLLAAREDPHEPLRLEARLSELGPPSAWTALSIASAHLKHRPEPIPRPNLMQTPDPRAAKGKLDFTLFTYRGLLPVPNGPAPDPTVAEAVSRIARQGFSVGDWEAQAKAIAPGLAWHEVLSVMLHGAPMPGEGDPFSWVFRLQIAAALVLAHVDRGWDGSRRKRVLFHLALGPVDWAVSAALIALARLAEADLEIRRDVEILFWFLRRQAPSKGYTTYAYVLSILWLGLRGRRSADDEEWRIWGRRAWSGGDDRPAARHGDLDLAGYAEWRVEGGAPVPDWDRVLAEDDTLCGEFDGECGRARQRQRLRLVDPASAEGLAIMAEGLAT
ncbi:MAG: hypothetical protein JW751_04190 [Polyangiaceae bacterium]|nr:hypothetical protein [Polyangiaceae bacterium]